MHAHPPAPTGLPNPADPSGLLASFHLSEPPPPHRVREALRARVPAAVAELYERLASMREFVALVATPEERMRLARAQEAYWDELLRDPDDPARAAIVERVATVHWRLGIPPAAMLLAYDFVARRLLVGVEDDIATLARAALWLHAVVRTELARALAVLSRLQEEEKAEVEAELGRLVLTDPLTGLPNRRLLVDRLERGLRRAMREGRALALLRVDVDRFKSVNDTWGHEAGDRVLVYVAERLAAAVRPSDTPARIGGDEFVVLLEGDVDEARARATAHRLVRALGGPLRTEAGTIPLGVSIGVAVAPTHAENARDLLRAADEALYAAKAKGGCRVEVAARVAAPALSGDWFESFLRACVDGSLHFLYQPQVALADGRLRGFEALLRWRYRGSVLTPDRFLARLDHPALARRLTEWSLEQACTFAAGLRRQAGGIVAVNLSHAQLQLADLPDMVAGALARHGLPADALEIEITEDTLLEAGEGAVERRLRALGEIGVRFALDDFGTGWASLAQLERAAVHVLKIDRGFVAALHRSPRARAIVRSVCRLARVLGAEVVAEGVESPAQAERLRGYRCRFAQGWLFARPLAADAALAFASRTGAGPSEGEEAAGSATGGPREVRLSRTG